jgi:hypothetical protein
VSVTVWNIHFSFFLLFLNLEILADQNSFGHTPASILLTDQNFLVESVRLKLHKLVIGRHSAIHKDLLD